MIAEPQEAPPRFSGRVLEARMSFQGPRAGELRLVTGAELASTVAANLLGEDEGTDAAARATDALGELLNMIVGTFVVELFGDTTPCKLGLPRVREIGPADGEAEPTAACTAHLVEEAGRRIDLSLSSASPGP